MHISLLSLISCLILSLMSYVTYFAVAVVTYKLLCFLVGLLRTRRNLGPKGLAQVIAHRGSRAEGLPENTIAAFKDAAKAGTHIVELDVWITPCGKVVVHHDETLTRMSGEVVHDKIWQTKYEDFPDIQPTGEQMKRCDDFPKDEVSKIPLFDTVLKSIPRHIFLIVEFKSDSDLLISEVKRILAENDRKQDIFWFSLDEKINVKLRAADPSIPTITSILGVLKILMLFYIGILPLIEIDDAVFGITVEAVPLSKLRGEKPLKPFPDWFKRGLAFILQGKPPYAMLAPRLFAHLRERGVPVWFLGVNSEEDLDIAVKAGATAVLTDRVNWLTTTMKSQKTVLQRIVSSE